MVSIPQAQPQPQQQAPQPAQGQSQPQPPQQASQQPPRKDRNSNSSGHVYLNGPVPGESLTQPPGNAKWEHPPQFADPNDASDYIFNQLLQPKTLKGILTMLKMGVPAEALARVLLFSGFHAGKWTPDICMLLFKPVIAMIVALGQRAKIDKIKVGMKDRSSNNVVKDLVKNRVENKRPIPVYGMDQAADVLKGLGSRPDQGDTDNTENE